MNILSKFYIDCHVEIIRNEEEKLIQSISFQFVLNFVVNSLSIHIFKHHYNEYDECLVIRKQINRKMKCTEKKNIEQREKLKQKHKAK